METSDSIVKITAALVAAQAEFPAVAFDAVNPFHKSRYATLGAVIEACRPVLARHGLAVIQPVVGGDGWIGIETRIIHSSGEWMASRVQLAADGGAGKSPAQAAGSTVTYLRRYGLAAALGLYADEDDDGQRGETKQPTVRQTGNVRPQYAPEAERRAEVDADMTALFGEPTTVAAPVSWPPEVVQALQEAGVIPAGAQAKHIKNFLALLPFKPDDPLSWIVKFGTIYREAKDAGRNTIPAVRLAKQVWAGWAVENPGEVPPSTMPPWVDDVLAEDETLSK
jgi:hypothetical protein